jgi:tRNA (guanine-N(7)-)-methyltransferase subunit TRM82
MPKRPSVLALTPDENDILCADKFGDVYIIPVIPSSEYKRAVAEEKEYAPSATNLTVHTKRNLESLEQQMRQAALKKKASAEATALNFEHQAIIGHVSMLTDMVSVTRPADSTISHPRNYILTADRDEHIRVSRGHPQAHVIEQYCFGHTSFISKLCIPSWAPNVLISGGGDKHLLVWNWAEGQVLQKVPLPESETDITVSGIWAVSDSAGGLKSIFVAFEGYVPLESVIIIKTNTGSRSSQLLCYTLENDNTLKQQETLQLSGNVIDLVSIGSKDTIAVSVDNLREPNSTSVWRSSPQALLETFRVEAGKWVPAKDSIISKINSDSTTIVHTELDEKTTKSLNEQLYGLSVLRKNGWN